MPATTLFRFAARRLSAASLLIGLALLPVSCRQRADFDPAYHEFAYVSNGKSDSVSVIDTLALRDLLGRGEHFGATAAGRAPMLFAAAA